MPYLRIADHRQARSALPSSPFPCALRALLLPSCLRLFSPAGWGIRVRHLRPRLADHDNYRRSGLFRTAHHDYPLRTGIYAAPDVRPRARDHPDRTRLRFAAATFIAFLGAGLLLLLKDHVTSYYLVPFILGFICLPMITLGNMLDGIARSRTGDDGADAKLYRPPTSGSPVHDHRT